MSPPRLDPAILLEHAGWLRSLARALAGDAARADDLAQETWLRALEHPPDGHRHWRGWLATVLTNLWRQERRLQRRRGEREARAARTPAQDVLDVVERAETHRRLVEEVTRLDEPFRTAVLLRYFDGLEPARIAERLRVPEATVRSRLRRGIERLRERLDARHGGERGSWAAALLRLGGGALPAPPSPATVWPSPTGAPAGGLGATLLGTSIGVFLMHAKLKLLVVLVLLGTGALLLPRWVGGIEAGPEPEEPVHVGSPSPTLRTEPATPFEPRPASDRAEVRALAGGATVEAAAPAAEAIVVRGRVLDAAARAVGDHPLLFRGRNGDEGRLASDAFGTFELEDPEVGHVVSASSEHATLLRALIRPGAAVEPVLVVCEGVDLAGVVVDSAGSPVEAARVEVELPRDLYRGFRVVLDASEEPERFATSGEGGSFDLGAVACVPEARLVVRRDGYAEHRSFVPQLDRSDLRVVLEPLAAGGEELCGFVLDEHGAPIEHAFVSAGLEVVRSAADGSFRFEREVRERATELVAVCAGRQPARERALSGPPGSTRPLWPDEVVLVLRGEALSLTGVVVDEQGAPLPGKRVWLADGTLFGVLDSMPVQLEAAASAVPSKAEVEAAGMAPSEAPHSFWNWVRTDDRGRFRLEGLLDREYGLKVMDDATLVMVQIGPMHPTADPLTVRFPERSGHRRATGRIATADGEPAPGVEVLVSRRCLEMEYGEGHSVAWDSSGERTLSGQDGGFALERVPLEGVELLVHGGGMRHEAVPLEDGADLEHLAIVVEREPATCHVQVELSGRSDRADAFELLDAEGERTPLSLVRGGSSVSTTSGDLVAGRSMVVRVPEGDYELVLYKEGARIESRWVTIVPGEVVVLRP